MTPSLSTITAVYGQGFNLSAVLKDPSTGNPKTGGLSGLVAYVSRDDGAFALTTSFAGGVAPAERGTSGWVSLDLTPEMMTGYKIDVEIRATGAAYACISIPTADLRTPEARFDEETVWRLERMGLNTFDFLHNQTLYRRNLDQTAYNRDNQPYAVGPANDQPDTGFRGKLVSPV